MLAAHPGLSLGLRVNPRYSEVETLLYNPCAPGTRFGVSAEQLPDQLPAHIEGFHCHCHCESGADVFARTLVHIEDHFAKWFPQIKWINFGGGHLMTRADYDVDALVALLRGFHARYPWLHIIRGARQRLWLADRSSGAARLSILSRTAASAQPCST